MPKAVVVFSGKRKSGKDYMTDRLKEMLGADLCALMRLSAPLKGQYAKDHGLDAEKLLDASEYKERYRVDMIRWGEEQRNKDPGFFCRPATLEHKENEKPVWIITDARRKSDIKYFKTTYSSDMVFLVKVTASEAVRQCRGWTFVSGVDDAPSECDLDTGVEFDFCIPNDGDESETVAAVNKLMDAIRQKLC